MVQNLVLQWKNLRFFRRDRKVWWNQAERLDALAFMLRLTGDQATLSTLKTQLTFIIHHQLDQTYGEWYPTLEADGSVVADHGKKKPFFGNRWKSPYHVMRGLYHAYHDLRRAANREATEQAKAWDDFCL